MTDDDGWRMRTYAKAKDAPTQQLQEACDQLHDGQSYFTNVIVIGTYTAMHPTTGETRTQVAVAAKVRNDMPADISALARRLREVVADLEAVSATLGQAES